jgi:hypothetical protein
MFFKELVVVEALDQMKTKTSNCLQLQKASKVHTCWHFQVAFKQSIIEFHFKREKLTKTENSIFLYNVAPSPCISMHFFIHHFMFIVKSLHS